jgi:hypothetical protein
MFTTWWFSIRVLFSSLMRSLLLSGVLLAQAPVISNLSPNSAIAVSADFILTVNGANFLANSQIHWNGLALSTFFVSDSQLSTTISAADLVTAQTVNVLVNNPGVGNSNKVPCLIANPVPTLSSLSPNSTNAGTAGITLTVNGGNFVCSSVARWNGSPRTTSFVSSTQLSAQITTADLALTGTFNLTVFNPTPGGGESGPLTFTVNNPVPSSPITLAPSATTAGTPGITLTITGGSFVSTSAVRWNGTARAATYDGPAQLRATISAADLQTAGTANVTVFNPTPGGGETSPASFTINNPLPGPLTLSPASVLAGSSDFTLTVNGNNFVAGSVVRWNGAPAANPTAFISSTQLTVTIPAASVATAGTVNVTVFNPLPGGGGASNALTFTTNNPVPALSNLSPDSTIVGTTGITLAVNGSNFVSSSVVRWNGAARSTTFHNSTQLTAVIPATDLTTPGTTSVTVFSPGPGGGSSNTLPFTRNHPLPVLASINLRSARAGGSAFSLVVLGSGFISGASRVRWSGQDRVTTFNSPTQLTASIPATDIWSPGTANVSVFNPLPGGGISASTSFAIIPEVGIAAADPVAAEAGLDPGLFAVTRSGDPALPLTVNYSISGTASSGQDFTALPGTVTIPVGSASADIVITPIQDALVEGNETVVLTLASSSSYSISSSSATVTIFDDVTISRVTILATRPEARESGPVSGEFTLIREGNTSAALVVNLSIGGNALPGIDYTTLPNQATIPAGSASLPIPVTPLSDVLVEGTESLSVTVVAAGTSYEVGSPSSATVNIIDTPNVTLTAIDSIASEIDLNPALFSVTRSGDTSMELTVRYTVAGLAIAGEDYEPLSGSVVIPAGQTSASIPVIPIRDTLTEGSETVSLTLISGSNYTVGSPYTAQVTILDTPPPTINIEASIPVASESGLKSGAFQVTRSGSTSQPLTVAYTLGGTAIAGSDYLALPGSLTIPAGESSAEILITPVDDLIPEDDETVVVSLSSGNYIVGPRATATVVIADDDPPTRTTVRISASEPVASEDPLKSGTMIIRRSGSTANDLVVNFEIGGSATLGVDYVSFPPSLLIPAGSAFARVDITPIADSLTEGTETVSITLRPGINSSYEVGVPDNATILLLDKDGSTPTVSILAADPIAWETGSDPGMILVARSGPADSDLTVNYTVSGTALSGADYIPLPGSALIPAGTRSVPIQVVPREDDLVEPDETVILALVPGPTSGEGAYQVGPPSSATVTIKDGNPPVLPSISVTADHPDASESGPMAGSFLITRTGNSNLPLTVLFTIGGTALPGSDYRTLAGSVTIPAGSLSATIAVLPISDNLEEGDETVLVTLSPSSAYSIASPASATVTIKNNPLPRVSIMATEPVASEAGPSPGSLTISRTGDTSQALRVNIKVAGAAISGTDFERLAEFVTIPAGASSAVLRVQPIDDTQIEPVETVIVLLGAGSGYMLESPGSARILIVDNDSSSKVSIFPLDPVAYESGERAGTFAVLRSGPVNARLQVPCQLSGTAAAGLDYRPLTGSVDLPEGMVWTRISITPIDDTLSEGWETVVVRLLPGNGYVPGAPASAVIYIRDNDSDDPDPALSISAISPSRVISGAPDFFLITTGNGFLPGISVVEWNQQPRATWFVSSTQLISYIPASDIAEPGTASITVLNSVANGQRSNAWFLTIAPPGPPPPLTITSPSLLPGAVALASYGFAFTAAGGRTPYLWDTIGTLPQGLQLDRETGVLSGAPEETGTFLFSVTVSDALSAVTSAFFELRVNPPPLEIVTPSQLADGQAGTSYSQILQAAGGVPPYEWSLRSGDLPPGLKFEGSTGTLQGIPTSKGIFNFNIQVRDSSSATNDRTFSLLVLLPPLPAVKMGGLPPILDPRLQPKVTLQLATPYPVPLSGELLLSFEDNAEVPGDDPTIQYSTGGRTVVFSIPANTLDALFPGGSKEIGLQSGTVAGVVGLTSTFMAEGEILTPSPAPQISGTINRIAPSIVFVETGAKTATGFQVTITGFSTPRSISQAVFNFVGQPGSTLETSSFTMEVGSLFATWYQSETGRSYGSQFRLRIPFTVQGDMNGINTLSVILKNNIGSSEEFKINF